MDTATLPAGELGVVLRTMPLRDADLVVDLYTVSSGRVTALARGGRKSQRRFAGALQLLVLGQYELGRRRSEWRELQTADVVTEWTRVSSDVVAVAHASYLAELVSALAPLDVPEPQVVELIVGLWDSLAEAGPSPAVLRAIELALLELTGHRAALDSCAVCGRSELANAVFDPNRGGAICQACAASSWSAGVRPIADGALAYLRAVAASSSPRDARRLDTDPSFERGDRIAGRDALVAMLQGLVGRPLKSLEYIVKLGSATR